jgi:penicillin-binding protein 1A
MPLQYLRRITTRDGQVVWEAPTTPLNVQGIPAEVRNPLRQLLEDVVNRGTGSRVRTAGYVGPVAGKTGTTNGGHDLWFAGFTPSRVGVVWMGLDQPATVLPGADGTGGRQAAPLWATVMRVGMTTVDSLPWPVVRDTTTTVPPVPEDSGMIPVVPIAQAADEVPMRWCLRDRTAADTGSVVNLVVPCPETP